MSKVNAVELNSMYLEVEKAVRTNRSRNVPRELNETTEDYVNLKFDLDIYKKIYWNNKISTEVTNKQFRHISWDFEAGVSATKNIDVYYRHYSGHVLDYTQTNRFNQENSIGIRFKLK